MKCQEWYQTILFPHTLKLKVNITETRKHQREKVFYSCVLEADSCFRSPSVPVWVLAVLGRLHFSGE